MKQVLMAVGIGIAPGAVLFLSAFVVHGEWQLTLGSWGIMLACVGAVAGLAAGLARRN